MDNCNKNKFFCIRNNTLNFKHVQSYNLNNTGRRFKFLREELTENCGKNGKSMSMRELAEFFYHYFNDMFQAGETYSHSRIERIENNKSVPSKLDLQLYHKLFGVPYEFLLNESESLKYENLDNNISLGLSDMAIFRLKSMASSNEFTQKRCLAVINSLFETGNDAYFYEMLYNYLFMDVSDIYPNKKIKESDIFEVKIISSDNRQLDYQYSTSIEIENINKLAYFSELEKMKEMIKSFGYRAEDIQNNKFAIYKTTTKNYEAGELVKIAQKPRNKLNKKLSKEKIKQNNKTILSTDKNDT